jgi:hypothetical protein
VEGCHFSRYRRYRAYSDMYTVRDTIFLSLASTNSVDMRRGLGLQLVVVALRDGAIAAALTEKSSSSVPAFVGCQACRRRIATFAPAQRQTQLDRRSCCTPAMWMVRDDGDGSESGASTTDSLFEIGSVDDLPEEAWQELEEGQPSEWMIMKDVC